MSEPKARLTFEHDNRVARVTLAAPKANILDTKMMAALETIFLRLQARRSLHAIVFDAEGPNFSYGASVEEHLPEKIGPTLRRLHDLLLRMITLPAPTIVAVRGQCLGGGFELVLACDLIVAEETAKFGCPEIELGVFPPAAAALLPIRVGASPATFLVLSGSRWSGKEAAAAELVMRTAPEGKLESVLQEWIEKNFLPRSAAALRYATRATRHALVNALENDLPALERLYLHELMAEPDAVEGVTAFVEKRKPVWGKKEDAA